MEEPRTPSVRFAEKPEYEEDEERSADSLKMDTRLKAHAEQMQEKPFARHASDPVPEEFEDVTPINPLIYLLGVCFLLLFAASCLGANTNTIAEYGPKWQMADSINYCVHFLFAPFVPIIVGIIDFRLCLLIGASGYLLLNLAFSLIPLTGPTIMIPCAIYKGFVSPVLWTGYGVFKSAIADETNQGQSDGIFFAIYKINQIVTNGLWTVFQTSLSIDLEVQNWMYFGFQCGAFLLFIALVILAFRWIHQSADDEESQGGTKQKEKLSAREIMNGTIECFTTAKTLKLLIIGFGVSAYFKSWFQGEFMKFLGLGVSSFSVAAGEALWDATSPVVTKDMDNFPAGAYLPDGPCVNLIFGFASLAGAYILGKVFDRVNDKKPLLYGVCITSVFSFALTFVTAYVREREMWTLNAVLCYFLAVINGLAIAGCDTILSACYGILCDGKATYMYSAHQSLYGLGMAMGKGLGGFWSIDEPTSKGGVAQSLKIGGLAKVLVGEKWKIAARPLNWVTLVIGILFAVIALIGAYLSNPLVAEPPSAKDKNLSLTCRSSSIRLDEM